MESPSFYPYYNLLAGALAKGSFGAKPGFLSQLDNFPAKSPGTGRSLEVSEPQVPLCKMGHHVISSIVDKSRIGEK